MRLQLCIHYHTAQTQLFATLRYILSATSQGLPKLILLVCGALLDILALIS